MKISRISEKHSVLDGRAEIYRTSAAGDAWQFRLYDAATKAHHRKSLKTRDLDSALERARDLGADLIGKQRQGIKVFGISLQELVNEWVECPPSAFNRQIGCIK